MPNSFKTALKNLAKYEIILSLGIISYFFLSSSIYAQNLSVSCYESFPKIGYPSLQKIHLSENPIKNKISYPRITPYLGAGLFPGGRVGIMVKFIKNASVEISYGYNLNNFVALSDEESKFGIGANYHFSDFPIHINLSYVYALKPKENHSWIQNPRYLYSLNAGYMPDKKGLTPFARIGLYYETYLQNPENEVRSGSTFFNFDLGIGWTF